MRSSTKLLRGFPLAVLAASFGLTGCGPDYALYSVHVVAQRQKIDDIKKCQMSIQNEKDEYVVRDLTLEAQWGPDNAGGLELRYGCVGGMTKTDVGLFSYSTSRTSGNLKFTVTAMGGPDDLTVIQQGSASAGVKAFPPEIPVELVMNVP